MKAKYLGHRRSGKDAADVYFVYTSIITSITHKHSIEGEQNN
jgi:hypothetical protein